MTILLYLAGAIVALAVGAGLRAWLRDRWHPITYTNVTLEELEGHVRNVMRRGANGTELIAVDEANGKMLRFRKEMGRTQVRFWVLADEITRVHAELAALTRCLSRICCVAFIDDHGNHNATGCLVCDCKDDINVALQVGREVVLTVYGLSDSATFTVWARGFVSCFDKYVVPQLLRSPARMASNIGFMSRFRGEA